jgi:hypothetical protein
MNDTEHRDLIEQRLRHTLHTLAATVTEGSPEGFDRRPAARRSHRRRWFALGIGAIAVPLAMTAASYVHEGSEYVDTIPRSDIVLSGSVDGSRYLLVESHRTGECGVPVTGVELVEEKKNLLGSEWSTTGYEYGEYLDTGCGYVNDTTRFLEDPARYVDGGAWVGDSFVWVYAVHPDVTGVRITWGDTSEDLRVHEVDGAGYAVFEVPHEVDEYTSELLIGGRVVPGSHEVQSLRRP